MRTEEEHVLLKLLMSDDERAYTSLYRLFYIPMLLLSRKYVNDEEAAKDLVQEVFISLLGRGKEFHAMAALKEYLYISVRNGCFNYLRHEKVKNRFELHARREEHDEELFWERVMEEDIHARLMAAVDRLPARYRDVIGYTLDGYKISEIARKMNISLDTAKEYKKEGKKRLVTNLRSLSFLVPWILSL
jgi:RNA polymerase sigma-70 factor (ECF subfamily)